MAKLRRPVAEGLGVGVAQPQVVGDIQIGDERWFLVDRHEARAPRLGGRADTRLRAPDRHPPRIGPDRAGQDLDEGGFARPVRAHQCHDLAAPHGQAGIGQRAHRAEALGHVAGVEKNIGESGGRGLGLGTHWGLARRFHCSKVRPPPVPKDSGGRGRIAISLRRVLRRR
jgi:hypothetical protein